MDSINQGLEQLSNTAAPYPMGTFVNDSDFMDEDEDLEQDSSQLRRRQAEHSQTLAQRPGLGKSSVAQKGFKRPYVEEIYSDSDEEQPDLKEYFSQWEMPSKDIALMCRSYASYICVQEKTTK